MCKKALIAEWLVTYAGSEKVLECMLDLYPQSDLFATVDHLEGDHRHFLGGRNVNTSFLQRMPFSKKHYQKYLPLMPLAVEQHDLSLYDVVISSNHAVAKGVLTGPDQLHISYVHSPIRYAWDMQHQYLHESGLDRGLKGWLAKWLLHKMRIWDVRTAHGVDHFIANSFFIARRIKKVYGRDADVIYPPVDIDAFDLCGEKEPFYFTASRMVPYKKMDLIVEAFSEMPDKRLVVIGDGPDFTKIKAKAGGNIELLGYQPFTVLKDYMQRAQAFVFAAEEDFGITPVEAQACGTPVIAFGKGGVLETVQGLGSDQPTGVFFPEQSVMALRQAVAEFESQRGVFSPSICRANAARFGKERFKHELAEYIDHRWKQFKAGQ